MTNRLPRIDPDGDAQIANAQVKALLNLGSSDQLSGYPLVHGTDVDAPSDAHHSRYADEEAQDAVGTILDGTLAYDDATPSIGVATDGITTTELSFDPATQTELDNHAGDTSNPHSVTASQAGAIPDSNGAVSESNLGFDPATQTELDSHAGSSSAHHSRYTDSEAFSAASYTPLSKSADYTAGNGEFVLADASGGAVTITAPSPGSGKRFSVKKTDASGSSVTVSQNGTENIEGQASIDLVAEMESVEFYSDGTDWYVL
jgi:hypothetical protein